MDYDELGDVVMELMVREEREVAGLRLESGWPCFPAKTLSSKADSVQVILK